MKSRRYRTVTDASATAERARGPLRVLLAAALKTPIHLYRWTLKPFFGWNCRHLPTCSEYALEAIDRNGPWRGLWLTTSRLCRCHRLGTAGVDPVPDIHREHHPLAPWLYGRWTGRHMTHHWGLGE